MVRRFIVAVGGAVIALVAVGCAATPGGDTAATSNPAVAASPSAPASGSAGGTTATVPTIHPDLPATKPPAVIPKTPSDPYPVDLLVGIVTQGGSGPCYQMETNDGILYALYGGDGVKLTRGDTIRVKIAPLTVKVDCGAGAPVAIVHLEVVGG